VARNGLGNGADAARRDKPVPRSSSSGKSGSASTLSEAVLAP
jgi:hypothetical protein